MPHIYSYRCAVTCWSLKANVALLHELHAEGEAQYWEWCGSTPFVGLAVVKLIRLAPLTFNSSNSLSSSCTCLTPFSIVLRMHCSLASSPAYGNLLDALNFYGSVQLPPNARCLSVGTLIKHSALSIDCTSTISARSMGCLTSQCVQCMQFATGLRACLLPYYLFAFDCIFSLFNSGNLKLSTTYTSMFLMYCSCSFPRCS